MLCFLVNCYAISLHNYCLRIRITIIASEFGFWQWQIWYFFFSWLEEVHLQLVVITVEPEFFWIEWLVRAQMTHDNNLHHDVSLIKKMMCSWIFYHITLFFKCNSWSFASSFLWHNLFHFSLALRANIVEASHGAWVNFSCISKRWETYIIMGAHAFASSKLHHMLLVVLEIVNTNDQLRLKG